MQNIFSYKANDSKFDTPDKLKYQIELVANRLIDQYDFENNNPDISLGFLNDDILRNRFRVRITF